VTDDSWIAPALAANPSTPIDLLLAMANCQDEMITDALCRRRQHNQMPADVAEILAGSPHARVRSDLVGRADTPLRLIAALAQDPHRMVRLHIAARREDIWVPLDEYVPEAAYALLARDPDPGVRREILYSSDVPGHVKLILAEDPALRTIVYLRYGDDDQSLAAYHQMLTSADVAERKLALENTRHTPSASLIPLLLADPETRDQAARQCPLTRTQAEELAPNPNPSTRRAVAANPNVPDDIALALAHDQDASVRRAVLYRSNIPIDLLNKIAEPVDSGQRTAHVDWLWDQRDNAELVAAYARSRSVVHRRTAAICPDLPADVLATLATDDDFGVRLMLAEQHPDEVPVELLTELVFTWNGYSSYNLVRNPRLPDESIDQLIRSDNSDHRWLAALSDRLTPEQTSQLAKDPDPKIAARVNPPPTPSLHEFQDLLTQGCCCNWSETARHPDLPVEIMWQLWERIAP